MQDRNGEARVLTLEEVLSGKGAGWLENWFDADDEDPEYKEITECAWVYGTMVTPDESIWRKEQIRANYGKKYGIRIWTQEPGEETREAASWE